MTTHEIDPPTGHSWREHLRRLLSDVIADYLNDDDITPDDLIEDIRVEIKSWIDYHQRQEMKASQIYCKLSGLANSKL